ncbi:MAG TPA: hypothetical protein VLW50_25720 [Streptosporangiaceae bacterium]|nr:hypothetical protein [Streptosporangiaceae bacterium]
MSEHDGATGPRGADAAAFSPDERAELEALRAEVAELRSRPAKPARHRISWRTPVATLLIILGCVLAPISILAVWTANQVSDTNRYVANVTPLIKDPAIQNALTDKITNGIVAQINVPGLTSQASTLLNQKGLPRVATLLQGFSGSLTSAVTGFVHSQVARIITGPRMANAWVQVNQVAHQELVKALSGRGGGSITVSNGQVTIGLAPFINIAKQDLVARGLTIVNKLPAINPTFALFPSKDLVRAQTAYRLINDLKIVLPIMTLLLLGLGVYIARGHRRALIGAGLGFAASMLVLGAGLLIARGMYLNTVPSSVLPGDAAAAAFDILVRFIKTALRTFLVVGLVVAAAAFITGPSVTAVRTRSAFGSGLGWVRRGGESHGLRTGPVGTWTYAHRQALRIGAVALAALIFVFSVPTSAPVVIVIVVLLLVVLGLIELIGRPPAEAKPPAAKPA